MASLITVRLNKDSSPSWGFRLQGGKDFGTPLIIQKVNSGTPAERAGLIPGDSVIKINNVDVFNLRHKDAQDVVVRAGNNFDMTIQRGGSTWKPQVIPTGTYATHSPTINNVSPVTKTSLHAKPSENIGAIGTGHNLSAKPFSPQLNGSVNGAPKLVNKQYNTPLKLYSEESIAETLSAQTEVLSTGALGVNFKKNEKDYDASKSAVYHMLQEAESDPTPDQAVKRHDFYATHSHAIGGQRAALSPPQPKKSVTTNNPTNDLQNTDQPGPTICTDCERVIVGVFVRIKDKNLHVECFKCATCGSSLKNVGYYNINNKLYCDIHAKAAAINNPPSPNLVPVTVQPGGKIPANAISAALATHSLPSPSPLSPKTNTLASPYQSGGFSGPKPFSSVSAPISPHNTLPRAAPLSPRSPISTAPAPTFSPAPSAGRTVSNVIWPPPHEEEEFPTACPLYFPPPSQVEAQLLAKKLEEQMAYQPKMSICSEEVCSFTERRKSASECVETISESLERQQLVETVLKGRPRSPPPLDTSIIPCPESIAKNVPCCRVEGGLKRPTQYTPNTVECQYPSQVGNAVPQGWESPMCQALRIDPFAQIPCKKSSSAFASALKTAPADPFTSMPLNPNERVPLPEETVPYFPPEHPIEPKEPKEPKVKPEKPDSPFVKALVIAPDRPFTPVGGVAPFKKKPENPLDKYIKELPKPQERLTMTTALTTAPERPYTPCFVDSETTTKEESAKVKVDKSMLLKPVLPSKLPESFQMPQPEPNAIIKEIPPILIQETQEREQRDEKDTKHVRIVEKRELRPAVPSTITKNRLEDPEPEPPKYFAPMFQGFSCSYQDRQFSVEVVTTPPVLTPTPTSRSSSSVAVSEGKSGYIQTETIREESRSKHKEMDRQSRQTIKVQPGEVVRQDEQVVLKKPLPLAQSLHPVGAGLPQYQVNISAEAEAEIKRMEKMERAQVRMEQQKQAPVKPVRHQAPVITVEPGDTQRMFKPVVEGKPRSITPRPVTPSMINKPPSVLPYYQANLVAHECPAASSNLLDPTSPAVSRSPSPCPGAREARERSPSPFPGAASRSKSPAAGPPPNPLAQMQPLPTPRDSRVNLAKQSLSTFIPQYKEKRDLIESTRGMEFYKRHQEEPTQMYTSQVQMQQYTIPQTQQYETSFMASNVAQQTQQHSAAHVSQQQQQTSHMQQMQQRGATVVQQQQQESSRRQVQNMEQREAQMSQTAQGSVCTRMSQSSHQQHQENLRQQERQTVETRGAMQIQRHQTVTEEYERTQKEQVVEVERTIKKHPFREVNPPVVEQPGVMGLHVTNPQPLTSPFMQADATGALPTQAPRPDPKKVGPTCVRKLSQPDTCTRQPDSTCARKLSQPDTCLRKLSQPETCDSCPRKPSSDPPPPPVRQVFPPGSQGPIKHVKAPSSSSTTNQNVLKSNVPSSDVGTGSGRQTGAIGGPRRGRGVLNAAAIGGARIPLCGQCHRQIRGPFITALGKIWCPDHFICTTPSCRRPLQDIGFVEERGQLYCEYCFEQYLAPPCSKCNGKIKGDCLKAIGKNFHPECFNCVYCGKLFGNSPFFLEDGSPYCEADWNELFTTKCYACGFPVEAGDRWVEALNNNYHSQCFNCTMCKKNLEGQSFFAKGGRPFCKNHAR